MNGLKVKLFSKCEQTLAYNNFTSITCNTKNKDFDHNTVFIQLTTKLKKQLIVSKLTQIYLVSGQKIRPKEHAFSVLQLQIKLKCRVNC